jgi:hypothetical protein
MIPNDRTGQQARANAAAQRRWRSINAAASAVANSGGPKYLATWTATDQAHKLRYKAHESAAAEKAYTQERYDHCADMCYEVLKGKDEPSEAIAARCHMYLATEEVGPGEAHGRLYRLTL